jgi:hypothetical protein
MNPRKIAAFAALSALALITGNGNAVAANPKGTQTVIIGLGGGPGTDQFCDVYTITIFPWHQAGTYDDSCDGVDAIGSGMEGKVIGVSPKDMTIGENYFGDPTSTYLLNIQYPLKTGNGWSIFRSQDGANYTPLSSGTYTVIDGADARRPRAGRPVHRSLQE